MLHLLQQYSDCNWTASGELECHEHHQNNLSPRLKNMTHTSMKPPSQSMRESSHVMSCASDVPSGSSYTPSGASYTSSSKFMGQENTFFDKYSGLNRELDISVYAPKLLSPRCLSSNFQEAVGKNRSLNTLILSQSLPDSIDISNTQHASNIPRSLNTSQVYNTSKTPNPPNVSDTSIALNAPTMSAQIMWSRSTKYVDKFKMVNNYYFQTPFQKYYEIVDVIGPPTLINPQRGGMAIWQNPGLRNNDYRVFKQVKIVDEQCFNNFPYPHIGFLYTYVKIKIPITILNKVLSISGDIMYDPVKKLLIVRGMSFGYNLALIAIVCQYVMGNITWYQIIDNNLIKKSLTHKKLTNLKIQKQNMKIVQSCVK